MRWCLLFRLRTLKLAREPRLARQSNRQGNWDAEAALSGRLRPPVGERFVIPALLLYGVAGAMQ